MKIRVIQFIRCIAALTVILHFYPAVAQEPGVSVVRSTEKVILNGKLYYIHTVQKGQTLYSISRAYGVSETELKNENPAIVSEMIKPGQALRIPIKTYIQRSGDEPEKPGKDDFIYHKVKQGQTIYFISKKYNVPIDILYRFNEDLKEGLKTGQVLKIPGKKLLEQIMATGEPEDKFIYYAVNENDTLYNISEKYGVPLSVIINYNEELRWGLKSGQIIRIPKPGILYIDSLQVIKDTVTLYMEKYISPLSDYECDTIHGLEDTIKVALLLPFFSREFAEVQKMENDTMLMTDRYYYEACRRKTVIGSSFIEFYEGVLLAVDSLKNSVRSINMLVRDTERDTNTVKKLIRELETFMPDIIIGPVFPENVRLVGDFAKQHKVVVVSPLSAKTDLIEDNPFIMQVMPSRQTELGMLADFISRDYNKNIMLVHNGDTNNYDEIDYFRERLFSNFYSDSTYMYIIYKEVVFNDSLSDNILNALSADKENIVFVSSSDEAYVMDAVNRLRRCQKDYSIKIFGNPVWQTWNNIDIEYLHDLELKFCAPYFIDYGDRDTRRFITKCRNIYKYEPYIVMAKGYNYCFLGYDITFYALTALSNYGKYFPRCIDFLKVNMLMSDYVFKRRDAGRGLENMSVSIINYNNDFTISKAGLR
jgi:LysM repeat protein/ABC-type branched-subunit amino acid transport system substrate-binding protein